LAEETILNLLGNVGVPAVICLYTLIGVNKTLKELTNAINKLSSDVDARISRLEGQVAALHLQRR